MDCYVCKSQATSAATGRLVRVVCIRCGPYMISQGSIRMFDDGACVDIERTQRWISSYAGNTNLPLLSANIVRIRLQQGLHDGPAEPRPSSDSYRPETDVLKPV